MRAISARIVGERARPSASQAVIRACCGRSLRRRHLGRDRRGRQRRDQGDGTREHLAAEHAHPSPPLDHRLSCKPQRNAAVMLGLDEGRSRRSCAGGEGCGDRGRDRRRRDYNAAAEDAMRTTLVLLFTAALAAPAAGQSGGAKPVTKPDAAPGAGAVPHLALARRDARQAGRGHHRARRHRHRPAARAGAQPRRPLHQDGAGGRLHRDDVPPRRAPGDHPGRRSADAGSGDPRQGRHRRPQPPGAGRPHRAAHPRRGVGGDRARAARQRRHAVLRLHRRPAEPRREAHRLRARQRRPAGGATHLGGRR